MKCEYICCDDNATWKYVVPPYVCPYSGPFEVNLDDKITYYCAGHALVLREERLQKYEKPEQFWSGQYHKL